MRNFTWTRPQLAFLRRHTIVIDVGISMSTCPAIGGFDPVFTWELLVVLAKPDQPNQLSPLIASAKASTSTTDQ